MKKGFTLSEVLITLVIIGIIAAITVPTIFASIRKNESIERLKKTYSTLNQAINLSILDNGPIDTWDKINSSEEFSKTYLEPYLSTMGKKGYISYEYTTLNKIPITYDCYSFYLNDGTEIIIDNVSSGGGINEVFISIPIMVDINGKSKPNIVGRDLFVFQIQTFDYIKSETTTNYFAPVGGNWSREEVINDETFGCKKSSYGMTCAALIMKDQWQMTKDYPW